MKSVDWGSIISAAAGSTLGVLSLIVLAVAFLAFFLFKGSGDKVKLGVFAAILVAASGFGMAVLRESPAADSKGSGSPNAASAAGDATKTTPGADDIDTRSPKPETDIAGIWRDTDGNVYEVVTEGSSFTYQQMTAGVRAGGGAGMLDGRTLRYTYVVDNTGERGRCTGTLWADGNRVEGKCSDGVEEWPFTIKRDRSGADSKPVKGLIVAPPGAAPKQ